MFLKRVLISQNIEMIIIFQIWILIYWHLLHLNVQVRCLNDTLSDTHFTMNSRWIPQKFFIQFIAFYTSLLILKNVVCAYWFAFWCITLNNIETVYFIEIKIGPLAKTNSQANLHILQISLILYLETERQLRIIFQKIHLPLLLPITKVILLNLIKFSQVMHKPCKQFSQENNSCSKTEHTCTSLFKKLEN